MASCDSSVSSTSSSSESSSSNNDSKTATSTSANDADGGGGELNAEQRQLQEVDKLRKQLVRVSVRASCVFSHGMLDF